MMMNSARTYLTLLVITSICIPYSLIAADKNMETRIYKKKGNKWQAKIKPGASLKDKLRLIKLPKIDFEKARAGTVFDYLSKVSKTLDPQKKGINIIHMGLHKYKPSITMNAEDIPIYDVIRYVCMLADLTFQVDQYAVVIKPNKGKKRKK